MPENKYDPLAIRDAFPANKKDHERPKQVVQATVMKPSPKDKLVKSIFASGFADLKDKIIYDVLIPTIKDTLVNCVKSSVDTIFYGKPQARTGYTNYSAVSQRSTVSYGAPSRAGAMSRETPRDREIEKNLSFDTRDEANDVLDKMIELIELYGQVSVADLCDLTGVDSEFTDNRYGWKDLRTAAILKRGQIWVLDLPRTRVID